MTTNGSDRDDATPDPAAQGPRTLLLVRHAKAEQWSAGGDDRSRSLSGRGRRDATAAGRWFVDQGVHPDAVACSPSNRTRETWAAIAAELSDQPEAKIDNRIYDADVDELLELVQETEADARTVVVVGHAPSIPELASMLDGSDHPDLSGHFATCGIAVLTVTSDWASLNEGGATLTSFVTPRG